MASGAFAPATPATPAPAHLVTLPCAALVALFMGCMGQGEAEKLATGWPDVDGAVSPSDEAGDSVERAFGLWVGLDGLTRCALLEDLVVGFAEFSPPLELRWSLQRVVVDVYCGDCVQPVHTVVANVDPPYGVDGGDLTWAIPVVAVGDPANGSPWDCDPTEIGYGLAHGTWRDSAGIFARSCAAYGFIDPDVPRMWPDGGCDGTLLHYEYSGP